MNLSFQSKCFDYQKARAQIGGNEERFSELAGFFQSYWRELMDPILSAEEADDRSGLDAAVHKLKGSLSLLAAHRALEVLASLEKNLKENGPQAQTKAKVLELNHEVEALAIELRTFIKAIYETT